MIARRNMILVLALPFAVAASDPVPANYPRNVVATDTDCPGKLGTQEGAPRFADYPAPRRAGHYVAPQLTSRQVVAHRSTLGAEAANGPNFAGNYTIAAWGCGYSCSAAAVINLTNGRVAFPDELGRISTRYVRDWVSDRPLRYRGMRFNPNSRLLIVIGTAIGDETDESAVYYEWTGAGLRQLAVIPRTRLCPS
jgi:hypothetical protein